MEIENNQVVINQDIEVLEIKRYCTTSTTIWSNYQQQAKIQQHKLSQDDLRTILDEGVLIKYGEGVKTAFILKEFGDKK